MDEKVKRYLLWSVAAVLLAALPAAGEEPGKDRWVPSLAATSGVTIQNYEAAVSSSCANDECSTTRPDIGNQLFPPVNADDIEVAPYVGGILQLMTPTLPVPGSPRVFASGEFLTIFSVTRDIAKEGDPTVLTSPSPEPTFFPEETFTGVGHRTTSELSRFAYGANLGLSFPCELWGRQLRFKPSAGYLRYRVDLEGRTVAGLKDDHDPPPPPPPGQLGANIREIVLTGEDALDVNAIGGGLEVEMDTVRRGPLGVSLFLGGNLYRVVGERSRSFGSSVTLTGDNLPDDTYTSSWSFEADPWVYRVGFGLRLHWFGD